MNALRMGSFLSGALLALSLPSVAYAALPFVVDDYGKALEQARSRGTPLFVEAWAPW